MDKFLGVVLNDAKDATAKKADNQKSKAVSIHKFW